MKYTGSTVNIGPSRRTANTLWREICVIRAPGYSVRRLVETSIGEGGNP